MWLIKLLCSVVTNVGSAAHVILTLSLPDSWQAEWGANKERIESGLGLTTRSDRWMVEYALQWLQLRWLHSTLVDWRGLSDPTEHYWLCCQAHRQG